MRLWRRYSVTVMDNWTSLRYFWTRRGAERWMKKHRGNSYLFVWHDGAWEADGARTSKGTAT